MHFYAVEGANFCVDFVGNFGIFLQPDADVVFALTDFRAVVAVPRAGFVDDVVFHADVDQFAFPTDAFSVEDVKLCLTERGGDFVFDDFDAGFVAQYLFAFFDGSGAADVEADGRIEFQRVAAGGGFGAAEHYADLHPDLVDEHNQRVGFFDVSGQFAQSLAHQARLQSDMAVPHIAFDFGFGDECGYGIDDYHIYAARTDECVADFQSLFAGIGLGQVKLFDFYAEFAGVNGIEGVFGIDKGAHAAVFLALGDGFEAEGGFAGGFWAEDFDDAPARQTADSEGEV
ncbi:Uncharacterised protein [Neisseria meningitidis]|nr:Uncharacterised protein [Neisseria meningitidis]